MQLRGSSLYCCLSCCLTSAPPTPTEVTAEVMNVSFVRVAWQWSSSGPAPNCFNTTHVTYHPEEGDETSLQLSDPAATEATLTDLQCNTNYTITVVATAGEHGREGAVLLPLQGMLHSWNTMFLVIPWSLHYYCRSTKSCSSSAVCYFSAFDMGGPLPRTPIPHLLQGDMWGLC